MTTQTQAAAPAPATPNRPVLFGGDAPALVDRQVVTWTPRVKVELRYADRESTAEVPIYEVPLLEARYQALGGSAVVNEDWLYDEASGREAYPRLVPLSRAALHAEAGRLTSRYVVATQNGGKYSFFEAVYGKGYQGLYDKITATTRAWQRLVAKMQAQGRFKPTREEVNAIVALARPEDARIDHIDTIEMPSANPGPFMSGDEAGVNAPAEAPAIDDPTAQLAGTLGAQGLTPEQVQVVVRTVVAGHPLEQTLQQEPLFQHKKGHIKLAQEAVRAWRALSPA